MMDCPRDPCRDKFVTPKYFSCKILLCSPWDIRYNVRRSRWNLWIFNNDGKVSEENGRRVFVVLLPLPTFSSCNHACKYSTALLCIYVRNLRALEALATHEKFYDFLMRQRESDNDNFPWKMMKVVGVERKKIAKVAETLSRMIRWLWGVITIFEADNFVYFSAQCRRSEFSTFIRVELRYNNFCVSAPSTWRILNVIKWDIFRSLFCFSLHARIRVVLIHREKKKCWLISLLFFYDSEYVHQVLCS